MGSYGQRFISYQLQVVNSIVKVLVNNLLYLLMAHGRSAKYFWVTVSFSLWQIWEAVDPKQDGYVTRDGLYKALALTALAQQGKSISEKALEQFVDSGKYQYAFYTENFITKDSYFKVLKDLRYHKYCPLNPHSIMTWGTVA